MPPSIARLFFLGGAAISAPHAPDPTKAEIIRGACPFECCTYTNWTATKASPLWPTPDANGESLGRIKAGDSVLALTGEIHARPIQFLVQKEKTPFHTGDVLWVYDYRGEGLFNVRFKDILQVVDLGFSPYGSTAAERCETASPACWGTLASPLKPVWWVQVKTRQGLTGWINQPNNFDGKDSCSASSNTQ